MIMEPPPPAPRPAKPSGKRPAAEEEPGCVGPCEQVIFSFREDGGADRATSSAEPPFAFGLSTAGVSSTSAEVATAGKVVRRDDQNDTAWSEQNEVKQEESEPKPDVEASMTGFRLHMTAPAAVSRRYRGVSAAA